MNKAHYLGRLTRLLCAMASTSLLAGCISFDHSIIDEPIKPARTLAQRPCCDSIFGVEAHPLPTDQYITLVLDHDDAVLDFPGGKSFTKAIQLPEIDGPYLLQIDSVVYRPNIDLKPVALYPVVTFLDSDLKPLSTHDNQDIDYRHPIFGPGLLRTIISLEAGSPARYALLHTSSQRLNQAISTSDSHRLVQVDNFDTILYSSPAQSRRKVRFVETGMVNVLAYPL